MTPLSDIITVVEQEGKHITNPRYRSAVLDVRETLCHIPAI